MQNRIILAALVAGASLSMSASAKEYIPVETPIAGLTTSLASVDHKQIAAALRRATYSEEDITTLQMIVEAEATAGGVEPKINVASTVINRVNSEEFPDTIVDVVYQKTGSTYQFSPVGDGRLYSVTVSETTIEAVDRVIDEGPTHECLFFCSYRSAKKKSKKSIFKDKMHYYYK